jgi:serine protease Do
MQSMTTVLKMLSIHNLKKTVLMLSLITTPLTGVLFFPVLMAAQPAYASSSEADNTASTVYDDAIAKVVDIRTFLAEGSGVIIDPEGIILTNWHVVSSSPTVTVILSDGQHLQGEVIASDPELDLAAVQLQGVHNLPAFEFAPISSVHVGHKVYAIGNPLGLAGTLSDGIVSRIDPETGMIQTNAAINPGNSGGALVDEDAKLIGIPTARAADAEGIGLAIATDRIQGFIAEAKRQGCIGGDRSGKMCAYPTSPPPSVGKPTESEKFVHPLKLERSSFEGQLGKESLPLPNDSRAEMYVFKARAGQRIKVVMESQEIAPVLILGVVHESDNGNDDLQVVASDGEENGRSGKAAITVTLPQDGVYVLIASSQPGRVGNYKLHINPMQ